MLELLHVQNLLEHVVELILAQNQISIRLRLTSLPDSVKSNAFF